MKISRADLDELWLRQLTEAEEKEKEEAEAKKGMPTWQDEHRESLTVAKRLIARMRVITDNMQWREDPERAGWSEVARLADDLADIAHQMSVFENIAK